MKNWSLLLTLLVILFPASVLLPGCSGGSTTSAVSALVLPLSFPITLSPSQTGTLNITEVAGTTLRGTLVVNPSTGAQRAEGTVRSGQAIPELPAGTYPVTGTYNAPRGFTLTAVLPPPVGDVVVSGNIPLGTSAGDYSITALGQTVSGTIPAAG